MYRANYPATVAEVLSDTITYKPEVLRAMRALKRAKPYRKGKVEQAELLRAAMHAFCDAYGMRRPRLVCQWRGGDSGSSFYRPSQHMICLTGRFSVVTFLHEFAHARGYDERQAVRWSVNLFRRIFPRLFAQCRQVGHTLVRD